MKELESLSDPPAQAGFRAITWEDVVWVLILSGLASLWMVLLMSPSWR